MEWFEEFIVSLGSQQSDVVVFQTDDNRRILQFLGLFKNGKSNREIYLYEPYTGLQKITRENGKIHFEPVTVKSAIAQMFSTSSREEPVVALSLAIRVIQEKLRVLMQSGEGEIMLVMRVLYDDILQPSDLTLLRQLIHGLVTRYEYYNYITLVIFTDAPEELIGHDLLKHTIFIKIPKSTEKERRELLKKIAERHKLSKKNLETIVKATRGLNLHELESVALKSIAKYKKLDLRAMTEYKYDIIRKSGLVDIEEQRYGFEAIGGYNLLKEFIRENIINILEDPKRAEKLGIDPPRGVLLFGPPGTGKTWFAKALAKELKIPFLRFKAENVVSEFYGKTTRNIGKVIETAESVAPCILFIDEIDRFGQRGHLTEHEESRRAFSVLLEWLGSEDRKTIVIGTTNRPEDLDEAFIRVGRFDYIIPVLYPDPEARREILKIHTSVVRKVPLDKDVDLDDIAKRTKLWTGAELRELVIRAARKAMRDKTDKVMKEHFEEALSTFKINYDKREEQLRRYIKLAEEFTNDAGFIEKLKLSLSEGRI